MVRPKMLHCVLPVAVACVFIIAFSSSPQEFKRKVAVLTAGEKGFGIKSTEPDFAMASGVLCEKLKDLLGSIAVPENQLYRIAIFKFGDKDWNVSLTQGNAGAYLQGGMVNDLQTLLLAQDNKFTVLLPDQLDQVLQTGNTDPQGLNGRNLTLARTLMATFNLDVCVFGQILPDQAAGGKVPIRALVVTRDKDFKIDAEVSNTDVDQTGTSDPNAKISGRFFVKCFVMANNNADPADPNSWQPLQLKRKVPPSTENLFFLEIDPAFKNMRFKMNLENKGSPAVGPSSQDGQRVFGAVVMVDGASSMFKKVGLNYRPQTGHPVDMPKEILTSPKQYLHQLVDADGDRFKGAELKTGDQGHHLRDIVGFQKGLAVAAAFRFGGPTNAAAAELVGPVSKLGTIQIFFYPEVFSDDGYAFEEKKQKYPGGIAAGEDVPSKRFSMNVKNWFPLPAETWNIVYRYKGDPSLPPLQDYP